MREGWSYLPYQVYANSIVQTTPWARPTPPKGDLNAGLSAWQDQLVQYGNDQGFSVNK